MATQQLRFDGEVAIVTGAGGKGLGSCHAELLASRGAKVVIFDLFEKPANEVVNRITANNGTAIAVIGSVAERADCEKAVQTAIETFGRVTILINNAGIDIVGPFESLSDEAFHKTIAVNLTGSWYMTKLVWPYMKEQKYGKIIMVSSNSLYGMANNSAYVASKGALLGLARSLAVEGKEFNVQVNSLGPIAWSPMAALTIGAEGPAAAHMESTLPAAAVSPVVAWLVHRDCDCTGEFICSFGSRVARMFLAETESVGVEKIEAHTIESVRDRMGSVMGNERFYVPTSPADPLQRLS